MGFFIIRKNLQQVKKIPQKNIVYHKYDVDSYNNLSIYSIQQNKLFVVFFAISALHDAIDCVQMCDTGCVSHIA